MRVRIGLPRSRNEWIVALIGAAVTVGCAIPLVQGVLSLSWPKVDGVITHSGNMPGRRAIGVDIGYRYATGGQTYSGSRFQFQFALTSRRMRSRDVQSILGRYRIGEPVKIAVNPGNPADSVLEPGPDINSFVSSLMGLGLLLLGLGHLRKDKPVDGTAASLAPARPRYRFAKVLAVAGCALSVVGAFYIYEGISSLQWPFVQGRILYSHARTGPNPETLLWYEYYVDNRRYVASRYRNAGNGTPFMDVAVNAAKRYPVGRVVPVYYNPRNPQDALLEPGVWWGNFVVPALALLVFAAAWLARRYADVMATRKA